MKTEWTTTLEHWCNELAKCEIPNGKKAKELEGYILATAMIATGYEWSTEEDKYIRSK